MHNEHLSFSKNFINNFHLFPTKNILYNLFSFIADCKTI